MILMRFLVIIFTLLIATAKGSESEKPRIGILTSGGDCSGLNSIIYAAYKRATILGYDVIGFKYGVHGLINDDYVILNSKLCPPDILRESGSILRSNTKILRDKSGKKLTKKEGDDLIIKEYHKLNLKGLIYRWRR